MILTLPIAVELSATPALPDRCRSLLQQSSPRPSG